MFGCFPSTWSEFSNRHEIRTSLHRGRSSDLEASRMQGPEEEEEGWSRATPHGTPTTYEQRPPGCSLSHQTTVTLSAFHHSLSLIKAGVLGVIGKDNSKGHRCGAISCSNPVINPPQGKPPDLSPPLPGGPNLAMHGLIFCRTENSLFVWGPQPAVFRHQ